MKLVRNDEAIKEEIENGSKIQCVKECRFYYGKNVCSVLTDNVGGVQNRCTFYQQKKDTTSNE